MISNGEQRLLVQALEGSRSVDTLAHLSGARPALVLTRHRLEAMGLSLTAEAACLPLAEQVSERELHQLAVAHSGSKPSALLSGLKPAGAAERGAVALMRRGINVLWHSCAVAFINAPRH